MKEHEVVDSDAHAASWRELRYHLTAEHGVLSFPVQGFDLLWLEQEHLNKHKTAVVISGDHAGNESV